MYAVVVNDDFKNKLMYGLKGEAVDTAIDLHLDDNKVTVYHREPNGWSLVGAWMIEQ